MSSGDVQSPGAGVPGVQIIQQLDIFHLQNGIYWINHSWDNVHHLGCGDVLHDALFVVSPLLFQAPIIIKSEELVLFSETNYS